MKRFSQTLSVYLLREVAIYAAIGFLIFAAILLSQNFVREFGRLAGTSFTASDLGIVLKCIFSVLVPLMLPVAFLFGILVAIGRMSADSEITAMRASGIGVWHLVLPLFVVSILCSLLMFHMLSNVEPKARTELKILSRKLLTQKALLQPTRFVDLGDRVFFANRSANEDGLREVMIWDRSRPDQPLAIFAEEGNVSLDVEEGQMLLELGNGDVHLEGGKGGDGSYRRIGFEGLEYTLDVSKLFGAKCAPRERSNAELREMIRLQRAGKRVDCRFSKRVRPSIRLVERHTKAMAPMVFVLMAVPLGLRRSRGGARSSNVFLCVVLVFGYYVLMTFGNILAEDEILPVALALSIPNIVSLAVSAVLLYRVRREEV